jgi:hypothetical protein
MKIFIIGVFCNFRERERERERDRERERERVAVDAINS